MPPWTNKRVAQVGDAGYCAALAAKMGVSIAISGSTTLGDALKRCNGNGLLSESLCFATV